MVARIGRYQDPWRTASGNVKQYDCCEDSLVIPQKVKHRITLPISLLGIFPEELETGTQIPYAKICSSPIHKSKGGNKYSSTNEQISKM